MLIKSTERQSTQDALVVACATLRSLPFFGDLPAPELEQVAQVLRLQLVEKRRRVVAPGAGSVSFLTRGLAKTLRFDGNGGETVLYLMKPGELFGAPITDSETDLNAVALQSSVTASVRIKDLEQIVGETAFASEVGRVRALRLRQMEERIDELSVGRVPARTARILLRLCKEFPKALHCGTRVDVLFTQQDIASMIGATREVTSSTLNVFRRRGWLGIHDRYMCVHDADELQHASVWAAGA